MILLKIIAESFTMAAKELFSSKMRSFLSLFGISIGILCLTSVFSAVDSLEKNIQKSVNSLGGDVIYVAKWPWLFVEDYPWWKFIQRPEVSREDFFALEGKLKTASAMSLWRFVNQYSIKNDDKYLDDVSAFAITNEYNEVREFKMRYGRYFSEIEFSKEYPKVILGNGIAVELFKDLKTAIGTTIKIDGVALEVIGILKKEGEDILGINQGFGLDNTIYLTDIFAATYMNAVSSSDPFIMVKAKDNIPIEEVEAELVGKMRIVRRLSPKQDDNFSLNKVSVFAKIFDPMFTTMFWIGLLIGGFSILVGVFGIANIMFVSVKERTNIIGVKKALGAKSIYILLEFFIEAVLLSLLGGIIGMLAVLGLFKLMNIALASSDFTLVISNFNMSLGLLVSISSGVIAGFVPAWIASRMNPVEAMRS